MLTSIFQIQETWARIDKATYCEYYRQIKQDLETQDYLNEEVNEQD